MPLLAQMAPSAEALGLFVLAAVFLSRWLWDFQRHKREESSQHEPKANPPLHRQFLLREEYEKNEATKAEEARRLAGGRKKLYEQVEEHGRQITALQVEQCNTTRAVYAMQTLVENLPGKITAIIVAASAKKEA